VIKFRTITIANYKENLTDCRLFVESCYKKTNNILVKYQNEGRGREGRRKL
jgi:hypothetical protein